LYYYFNNRIKDNENPCWVEIIENAYINRLLLLAYPVFPEPNFLISSSPILYNNNNGIHNNIVLNLCNLLQFNQTTMQQLNNALIKCNPTQKDFLNQVY
jgi:hypothetical protein